MKKSKPTIESLLEIIKRLEARIRELEQRLNKTAAIAQNHHQVMGYQNHHAHLHYEKTVKIKVAASRARPVQTVDIRCSYLRYSGW